MTTRRSFLAAAFGAVTARALPVPRTVNYFASAPRTAMAVHMEEWYGPIGADFKYTSFADALDFTLIVRSDHSPQMGPARYNGLMRLSMKDMLVIREVMTTHPEMRNAEERAAVDNLLDRIAQAINATPSRCPVCGSGVWSCGH